MILTTESPGAAIRRWTINLIMLAYVLAGIALLAWVLIAQIEWHAVNAVVVGHPFTAIALMLLWIPTIIVWALASIPAALLIRWVPSHTALGGRMVSRFLSLTRKSQNPKTGMITWSLHLEALDRYLFDLQSVPIEERGRHVVLDARDGLNQAVADLTQTPGQHRLILTTNVFSSRVLARYGFRETTTQRSGWLQTVTDIVSALPTAAMHRLSQTKRRNLPSRTYERFIDGVAEATSSPTRTRRGPGRQAQA